MLKLKSSSFNSNIERVRTRLQDAVIQADDWSINLNNYEFVKTDSKVSSFKETKSINSQLKLHCLGSGVCSWRAGFRAPIAGNAQGVGGVISRQTKLSYDVEIQN